MPIKLRDTQVIHSSSTLSRFPVFYPITTRMKVERVLEDDGSTTVKKEFKEWVSHSSYGKLVATSSMTFMHKRFLMALIRNVKGKRVREDGSIAICVCMSEVIKSSGITSRDKKLGFDLLTDMKTSDFSIFEKDSDVEKDIPRMSMSLVNSWYVTDGKNGRSEIVFNIDTGRLGNIRKMKELAKKYEFGVVVEFSPNFSFLFTNEFLTLAYSQESKEIQKIKSGYLYAIVDNLLSHRVDKGGFLTRKLETVAKEVEIEPGAFNKSAKQGLIRALKGEKNIKILEKVGIFFDDETEVFTRYHKNEVSNMKIPELEKQAQMNLWGANELE